MRLVLDASAALYELVSPTGLTPVEAANDLLAPVRILSEITSVLSETTWRGEISRELADVAFFRLRDSNIETSSDFGLYEDARQVAALRGWAKTNDAEYVALAMRESAPLFTRDARLARGVADLVAVLGPDDVARSD